MRSIAVFAFVFAVTAGCGGKKDDTPSVCDKYAELEIECGKIGADGAEDVRRMARDWCAKALAGNDMMGIGDEVACAKKHSDCTAYRACTGADAP